MIHSNYQLNAQGLACPMPIVKTKQTLASLQNGEVLEVQATDQGSIADLQAWAKATGQQYIGYVEENKIIYHYLRKCDSNIEATIVDTTIPSIQLEELTDSPDHILIDVREKAEFAFGHIPFAVSIPLGELEGQLSQLPKDKAIYIICRTGMRSSLAVHQLLEAGFKRVFNVLPGMENNKNDWKKEV